MDSRKVINIYIVDDHQLVINGIKDVLSTDQTLNIIGSSVDVFQALQFIELNAHQIDILIADINMPNISGIELCKIVKQNFDPIKVLFISMHNELKTVSEAILAKPNGYILKTASIQEYTLAIKEIFNNGFYYSEDLLPILYDIEHKIKTEDNQLTKREIEILNLIGEDFTSDVIAQKLFISKKTVDNHRAHLLEKTNSKSSIGLILYGIKHGYIKI